MCRTHPWLWCSGLKSNLTATPSAFLAARLDLAKRLYDAGRVEMIVVSGDHRAPEYDEPVAMRDYLIRAGVPGTNADPRPWRFRHLRVMRTGQADLQCR